MTSIARAGEIRCLLISIHLPRIHFDTRTQHPPQRMFSINNRVHHLLFTTSKGAQWLQQRPTMHQSGVLDDLTPKAFPQVRPHEMVRAMEVRVMEVRAMEVQAMEVRAVEGVPCKLLSMLAVPVAMCILLYGSLDLSKMFLVHQGREPRT